MRPSPLKDIGVLAKAASAAASILFASTATMRGRFYEIFSKLHLVLAAVVLAAV